MNDDYLDLKNLQNNRGYHKLQALWAHEYGEVMKGLQKSAARNNEANWRYKAGEMKGFELAIGQLDRALLQIEKETDSAPEERQTEDILAELRGDKK